MIWKNVNITIIFSFSPIFQREVTEDDSGSQLIVIQCDSGHNNGDLIACARYRIYDERVKSLDLRKDAITHVLLIINLPHELLDSSFVGFQGDPWISAHIDDLKPSSEATIQPQEAISETISKIFIGRYLDNKNSTSSESQSPPTGIKSCNRPVNWWGIREGIEYTH